MKATLEKQESRNVNTWLSNDAGNALQRSFQTSEYPASKIFCTKLIHALVALVTLGALLTVHGKALAHGFNANHVDIVKTFGRKYRVIIKYTHVELGEYREAHIDFDKKEDAIKAFQDLVKGADFFLGDVKKSIHFHTPPEGNSPY